MERSGLDLFWKQSKWDSHKSWLNEAVGERSRGLTKVLASARGRIGDHFVGKEVGRGKNR